GCIRRPRLPRPGHAGQPAMAETNLKFDRRSSATAVHLPFRTPIDRRRRRRQYCTGAQQSGRGTFMAEYLLYGFAQSVNSYKAALMLTLGGADWKPCFVDFFNGETRTPAFRAVNVMGEVPVLEHAGKRLTQSGVILDYLAERLGKFGPADADERREILRWLLFGNHKLTSYTATPRYLVSLRK